MTRRLYHGDSYVIDFEALVVSLTSVHGKPAVALEATHFYPSSGGQPGDTGTIGGVDVEVVIEDGDEIFHLLSGKAGFLPGDRVRAHIAWPQRFINMQQHTGQHILSQAFLRVLKAPTVSSKLGTEHSTIDVARLDLTWDGIDRVEGLSNAVVFENRQVRVYEAGIDDVSDLRLKRPPDRERVRVVEVDGFDKSPCGGTHVRMTGEVGPIKILRWEKVRDTSRIEFICGKVAQADYFWKSRFVVELAQELTTKDVNVPGLVRDLLRDHRDLRRAYERLGRELAALKTLELEAAAREVSGVRVAAAYLEDAGASEIKEMAAQLTQKPGMVVLLAAGTDMVHFIFARSDDVDADMRPLIRAACQTVDGRGGGKPGVCQGGGKNAARAAEALKEAENLLLRMLKGAA